MKFNKNHSSFVPTENFTDPSSFFEHGFVVIENVLSKEEVDYLRDKIIASDSKNSKFMKTINFFLEHKGIYDLQFNQKINDVIFKIAGPETVFVNNIEIQKNMFGLQGKGAGWHVDCGSESNDLGNQYLFDKRCIRGRVGVFLQDNTSKWGGAIDIDINGHKQFRNLGNPLLNFISHKILQKVLPFFSNRRSISIKAGSAIFFDSRTPHRSTPAAMVDSSADVMTEALLPDDRTKIAIYWEATNKQSVGSFLDNAKKRAIVGEGDTKSTETQRLFSEYLSYGFPEDYPDDYVKKVNSINSLSIASIDENKLFKDLYTSLNEST